MSKKPMNKNLSDAEIMLRLARESLERWGTVLPPPDAFAPIQKKPGNETEQLLEKLKTLLEGSAKPAPLIKRADKVKSEPEKNWEKEITTCSRKGCGHTGPVIPDFGLRVVRVRVSKQSRCRKCRSEVNYHAQPRTYNVGSPSGRRKL
jgi:hypothetical protein